MDGSTTTVTVDVPPGTPLQDIPVPDLPPLPTTTTPVPTPTGTPPPPGDSGSSPTDQQNPDQAPNSKKGKQQKKSGGKQKATASPLDQVPNAKPQSEVKKQLDQINQKLYQPNGVPAPTNPTYFDALPGPAVAPPSVPAS